MRDHFHVPDRYFLNHSVGCLPRRTAQALQAHYLEPWALGQNWSDWMPALDGFRTAMAGWLGVEASTICPQQTISSSLTKLLNSLPVQADRNVILLSREDFPTIGFVVQQAERLGYALRFINGPAAKAESWLDVLDESVAVVHVTHALSNTSHVLPVAEICNAARQAGVLSIVDVAQSIGILPITPRVWGADAVTGTSVKFLCGGPGACFLYVEPEILPRCRPIDVGWFSHENPFEMEIEQFRYASDAMRFFGGTPSPAPLITAMAAFETWDDIGPDIARREVAAKLSRLILHVPEDALVSPRPSNPHGATLVVNPPDRTLLSNALQAANIHHDQRKEGFRFSLHGYTSEADCAALADVFDGVF